MSPARSHRLHRLLWLGVIGWALGAAPGSFALLNIDGTRNQVFVFGHVTIASDSNVFSDSSGRSDYMITSRVGAELKRLRGIIAVNASATLDYVQFDQFRQEGGWNPSLNLELNKTSGRTTGALTVNAYRTNRSDSAVNIRTTSWNVPVGLNIKYPVNDKLYLTSNTGYLRRSYSENTALLNYTDYTQGLDVFYVYNSRLDLVGGYRLRASRTSLHDTYDHSLSLGATGGLLPKLNGTLRLGYQFRELSGGPGGSENFSQFTVSSALKWIPTRKLTFSLDGHRDFTTTAIGGTVDTLGGSLHGSYTFNRKLEINGGISYGRNRFLGRGAVPREDVFFSWDAGVRYTFNEHLTFSGSYNHLINWSTLSFSDFERTGYSVDISSRF